jgi:iron complex outermembrane receptor protein
MKLEAGKGWPGWGRPKMKTLFGTCAAAVLLVALDVASASAQTQRDSNQVQEVIVNARKREERLRDIPVAATVVDQAAIQDQGQIRTVENLIANAPGVHFLDTNSPVTAEISIRGSGTSRGTNAEAAVGLYRDGAYIGGGALGGRAFTQWDLFDISRADVLRGTQGALFGRNAVGGAINVITQKPTFDFGGKIFAQYGSKDYKQVDLILNVPLTEHISTRLSVSETDQSNGFFYNPSKQTYYDVSNSFGQRAQVRYSKGPFDGNVLVEHWQATLTPVIFQVVIPNGTSPGFPGGYVQQPYSYPHNGFDVGKQQLNDIQATWGYNLGWAKLDSSTLYRERKGIFAFDSDAIDPPELARIRAANVGAALTTDAFGQSTTTDLTKSFFDDLHLSGAIGSGWNYVIGAEYLDLKSHSVLTTGRTPTAANGQSPGTYAPADLTIKSTAIYGLVGYSITPTLNASLEGRSTDEKRNIVIDRFDLATNAPVTPVRFSVRGNNSPNHFDYTGTLGWKFTPSWLLYGKVGTAFRAGNFNTDLGDPRGVPIPPAYQDEESKTYELGVKGNLIRPLFTALTLFKTNTQNALVQKDNGCNAANAACPVAATNYLTNGGEVELYGEEFEANYRQALLGGLLRLNGGLTHLKGKIISGSDIGKEPARLPHWQLKFDVNYRHLVTGRLYAFGNLRYSGEWGGKQEIDPQLPIPFTAATTTGAPSGTKSDVLAINYLDSHALVNLRLGVQKDKWELAFYADNAFDEHYLVNRTPTTNRLNLPRRIGVQLRAEF